MEDKKRAILDQVRTGSITAEEGAARLDELASENVAVTATRERPSPPASQAAPQTASVKVLSRFGSAEVVADRTGATAVADAPPRGRADGDPRVMDHEPFQEEDPWTFGMAGRRIEINGFDFKTRRSLKVRRTPDLPLAVSVQAGSLRVD